MIQKIQMELPTTQVITVLLTAQVLMLMLAIGKKGKVCLKA